MILRVIKVELVPFGDLRRYGIIGGMIVVGGVIATEEGLGGKEGGREESEAGTHAPAIEEWPPEE